MKQYGLIGHPLGHSFSQAYFTAKFLQLGCDAQYLNFDLDDITLVDGLIKDHPDLQGFNVTIPYKEAILPYLMGHEPSVDEIQAVNTVKVLPGGRLFGYNTDAIGFELLLEESGFSGDSALVFGTGGASKAVQYVLRNKGIGYQRVSRSPQCDELGYSSLSEEVLRSHLLLVNATPLGTFPRVDEAPMISYHALSASHTLIDLVYNPAETLFLHRGKLQGAKTFNGLAMLHAQAEASWKIWNT